MIVCPNCNHQNPDGAVQCEACYTPLPSMEACPNCGAAVQADASFCGQCGYNLQAAPAPVPVSSPASSGLPPTITPSMGTPSADLPDPIVPDPLVEPEPLVGQPSATSEAEAPVPPPPPVEAEAMTPPPPPPPDQSEVPPPPPPDQSEVPPPPPPAAETPEATPPAAPPTPAPSAPLGQTQLQTQVARLLHVQTNTLIELPSNLTIVHLGKPNDRIPPDIDVAGFPNSEIVSRIHADIRVEGDSYFLEDVGSSNGTYVNNAPLPMGNRHRLRPGDRIALGKGDQMTFLFQLS